MFHTCGDGVVVREVVPLESTHHGDTQFTGQIGVFAQTLGNTSPAGVARDVEHGSEGPCNTLLAGFGSGHVGAFLDELRVERGCHAQRNGQYRFVAVDNIPPDDEGDPQP